MVCQFSCYYYSLDPILVGWMHLYELIIGEQLEFSMAGSEYVTNKHCLPSNQDF